MTTPPKTWDLTCDLASQLRSCQPKWLLMSSTGDDLGPLGALHMLQLPGDRRIWRLIWRGHSSQAKWQRWNRMVKLRHVIAEAQCLNAGAMIQYLYNIQISYANIRHSQYRFCMLRIRNIQSAKVQKKMLFLAIELHQPHNDERQHFRSKEQVVQVRKGSQNVRTDHYVRHANDKPLPEICWSHSVHRTHWPGKKSYSTLEKEDRCPIVLNCFVRELPWKWSLANGLRLTIEAEDLQFALHTAFATLWNWNLCNLEFCTVHFQFESCQSLAKVLPFK